jgi:AcrR family transcriptional regulator
MRKNRYEKILAVSAHLISNKGYEGVSLQEIADKVGLHKSSLFHYVDNKEELLVRIFEKVSNELFTNLKAINLDASLEPEEKLKRAIDNHLSLMVKYSDDANIFINQLRSLPKKKQAIFVEERRRYEKDFEGILIEMKKKGYFGDLDIKIVRLGLFGMLNWVLRWFKRDGRLTMKKVSDIFYKLIVERGSTPNFVMEGKKAHLKP